MKVTHRSAHSEMVFLHAIHWGRQFHALRSGILQSGAENPATPRQPVRHQVVTHVLGTICYLCVSRLDTDIAGGEGGIARRVGVSVGVLVHPTDSVTPPVAEPVPSFPRKAKSVPAVRPGR